MDTSADNLHIDLYGILRKRFSRGHLIPHFLVRPLEHLICQKRLNEMLDRTRGLRGPAFCAKVLEHLNFNYRIVNPERLSAPDDRRVIYVSNHPLGGLDGMALIDMVARHHGEPLHFVVNDLLMAVKPLSDVFLPINKYGAQSREASTKIEAAFDGPDPLLVFPAGLVSRLNNQRKIRDLKWHKMVVTKAVASHRDIIPLFFDGENSKSFYNFAKIRERIGLKFNFEMVLLPSEVFKSAGKTVDIHVGPRIPWQTLRAGSEASAQAQELKAAVYALSPENQR